LSFSSTVSCLSSIVLCVDHCFSVPSVSLSSIVATQFRYDAIEQ
jgi:hypothetical protein